MKNILVCTDFSSFSDNALYYAINMAAEAGATVHLLNIYYISAVPNLNTPPRGLLDETEEQIETMRLERLKESTKNYIEQGAKIELLVRNGLVEETIIEVAKERNCDLILTGTKGLTGIARMLFGSVTANLLDKALPCPLMTVPESAEYKDIRKIVFASTFSVMESETVEKLATFAKSVAAEIVCLHINADAANKDYNALEQSLMFTPIDNVSYKTLESKKFVKGIDEYLEQSDTDILAMLTYSRNFVEQIFDQSLTKKMLFHTKVPLLVYQD